MIKTDDMETNNNEKTKNYDLEKLQSFLNQIKTINDSYERVKILTGENYNIFKLLGVESSELLHSKIVGDFLNPKGSHKQGSKFLELFVQMFNNISQPDEIIDKREETFFSNFKCEKAHLKLEESIGKIKNTDETNEGGRIDILVRDEKNNAIIIENKIYAGEQAYQLERYHQFGKGKTDFIILYLTLDGKEPESIDKDKREKIICISYKEHIISWLELCKKEVVNLPIIRETISQYINLLKKLTNQTENQIQAMEIQKLILKNYETSKLVNQNFEKAIYGLCNKILVELKPKIEEYVKGKNWKIKHIDENLKENKSSGGISVVPVEFENSKIRIKMQGINPFYKHLNENSIFQKYIFLGVLGIDGNKAFLNKLKSQGEINDNFEWWNDYEKMDIYENTDCRLDNPLLLKKLADDGEAERFVDFLFEKFTTYFDKHYKMVETVLKENQ